MKEQILTKIDQFSKRNARIAKLRKNYDRELIGFKDLTIGVLNQLVYPDNGFTEPEILEFDNMLSTMKIT